MDQRARARQRASAAGVSLRAAAPRESLDLRAARLALSSVPDRSGPEAPYVRPLCAEAPCRGAGDRPFRRPDLPTDGETTSGDGGTSPRNGATQSTANLVSYAPLHDRVTVVRLLTCHEAERTRA